MREQLHETLSALMDNEASELEVQQVLTESHGKNVRNVWFRFHLARAALHEEAEMLADNSLSTRICEHLAKEAPHVPGKNWRRKPWLKPFASLAVAASVAAIVFLGAQNLPQLSADKADASPLAAAIQPGTSSVINTSQPGRHARQPDYDYEPGIGSMNAAARANYLATQAHLETQFNRHMMLHAEHAALNSSQGMMPFARVARFDTE